MKKWIRRLHLWLGLASGLVVCFLGITGCIIVFEQEIGALSSFRYVTLQNSRPLPPSVLKTAAEKSLARGRNVVTMEYRGPGDAALAYYYNDEEYFLVFLNPYTGAVLETKNMDRDFFRVVTMGHYYLWLPPGIGQPIVASATLIFLIMLITGIILWWPKNKAARKQRFSIKWDAKWRRVNYDLHNVPGFYISGIIIFIVLTGLVMGFKWFADGVYRLSSGGSSQEAYREPVSDTLQRARYSNAGDILWARYWPVCQTGASLSVHFPAGKQDVVCLRVNHRPGTYYNQDSYCFDQYTLQPIAENGAFAGTYRDATLANKISRMNYDIHVGAIGGLFTKILAFLASLITASLPITGFLVWRGRKKKKTAKRDARPAKADQHDMV